MQLAVLSASRTRASSRVTPVPKTVIGLTLASADSTDICSGQNIVPFIGLCNSLKHLESVRHKAAHLRF
jgi:hypothetical protein